MADNVLPLIPGDLIAKASQSLPDASTDQLMVRDAEVTLPDGTRARITFTRFHHKQGKRSRWFWTPESATAVREK